MKTSMKKMFLTGAGIVLMLSLFPALGYSQGFTVNGKIKGLKDGDIVLLKKVGETSYTTLDSVVAKNEQFVLKGKLKYPTRVRLIASDPKDVNNEEFPFGDAFSDFFYLNNETVTFEADTATMPGYYYNPDRKRKPEPSVIKGAALNEEYKNFQNQIAEYRTLLSSTSQQYDDEYYTPAQEGKFNTARGIALCHITDSLNRLLKVAKIAYIRNHPDSYIAMDEAISMTNDMGDDLTPTEAETLEKAFSNWAGDPASKQVFTKNISTAKNRVIGVKYIDDVLIDPNGKKVKLSSLVANGKYTLLEFWASWCGPCRGEIPHLKQSYKNEKGKLQIISISLDENNADWKKALKEEKMLWPQLRAEKSFEGKHCKGYGISGIPFSLLLDKEGRVITNDTRGAALQAKLQKLN